MMKYFIYIVIFLSCSLSVNGQSDDLSLTDSLLIDGRVGLMGRWQSGNLNQVSVLPSINISLAKKSFDLSTNVAYHYLEVEGFNAINDLWINVLYQHRPAKRIFPAIHFIGGFAKSYRIDRSYTLGLGAGMNIRKKSSLDYFQVYVIPGYLDFQFEQGQNSTALSLNGLIKARFPLASSLHFIWELSSYQSTKDAEFWGGGNLFQLDYGVTSHLSVNIRHQLYHNNEEVPGTEKTNATMLFGIQYNLK